MKVTAVNPLSSFTATLNISCTGNDKAHPGPIPYAAPLESAWSSNTALPLYNLIGSGAHSTITLIHQSAYTGESINHCPYFSKYISRNRCRTFLLHDSIILSPIFTRAVYFARTASLWCRMIKLIIFSPKSSKWSPYVCHRLPSGFCSIAVLVLQPWEMQRCKHFIRFSFRGKANVRLNCGKWHQF